LKKLAYICIFISFLLIPLATKESLTEGLKISFMRQIVYDSIKENKVEFLNKLDSISIRLQINPDWLIGIMFHESGLNHRAKNSIGATGLIQFMQGTMKWLKTDSAKLQAMSNVEQLEYVYRYYKSYGKRFKNAYDMYVYAFMPIGVGKPDNWVFEAKNLPASIVAKQNKVFDLNKDGKITMAEFKKYVKDFFDKYEINPE